MSSIIIWRFYKVMLARLNELSDNKIIILDTDDGYIDKISQEEYNSIRGRVRIVAKPEYSFIADLNKSLTKALVLNKIDDANFKTGLLKQLRRASSIIKDFEFPESIMPYTMDIHNGSNCFIIHLKGFHSESAQEYLYFISDLGVIHFKDIFYNKPVTTSYSFFEFIDSGIIFNMFSNTLEAVGSYHKCMVSNEFKLVKCVEEEYTFR